MKKIYVAGPYRDKRGAKGLCVKHYNRLLRRDDPLLKRAGEKVSLKEQS